jgi:hypothetical protein
MAVIHGSGTPAFLSFRSRLIISPERVRLLMESNSVISWKKRLASFVVEGPLATLDHAGYGAATDVTPKFVSPSDPAAQWTGAMRGPAFFAYANNYLIDVKFGVTVDVEASRAIRQAEVGAAKTMIERTEQRFSIMPERLAADSAYGSATTLNGIVNEKNIVPHIPVIDKSEREDGTLS